MSRLFEHVEEYHPYRERRPHASKRPPLTNPGIFVVQRIADSLGTTVADLMGEAQTRLRDQITADERRTLRDALDILRRLLDLTDPKL